MWKDFFYYSRSERRAIYVLLTLIALLIVAIVIVPERRESLSVDVVATDSVGWKKSVAMQGKQKVEAGNVSEPVLNVFDPNLADSIELSRLGLSEYVVRNVIKYRQKGGRFRSPESFARIYGLTDEKFLQLLPYIRISDAFVPKPKSLRRDTAMPVKHQLRDTLKRPFKYPEGTLVDANLADTVELKKIPGIGSGIAKMIVSYRNRLGGFCSLEQLLEVKFVTPELLEWFKLEAPPVRKLQINKAGLDKLRAHPYINFYQAKVIVEHRRKRGEIKSLSQLSLYEEFTEKDLNRLLPYISFD